MKPWPTGRMRSAAGSDGSLGVAAAAARVHGLPFVCVPAGTRNHFALDLGVDRHDLVGALDAFGDHGVERSIDVAEVNGRVFLNNVSLGIYGEAAPASCLPRREEGALLETTAEASVPVRAAPELRVVDDLAASIVTRPCCSCQQPLRARPPRRARHAAASTAASSASSCSTACTPGGILGPSLEVRRTAVDATAPVHAGVDGEAVELDAPSRS